jgi:ADP-L-glycero-D-manno-heptose 6-epimerase
MHVVTGGAGFIGSNLVARLSDLGEEVVVCDWMGKDDRWRNLAKHEVVSIVPPETLGRWLSDNANDVRSVVHLGAISTTTETDVDLIAERNIRSTLELLDWCTGTGTPFIYASSAATYGDGSAGFKDDTSPEALAKLRPLNAYGWSKHFVDRRIARLAERKSTLPAQWVGLKFFNVYGPNEYHKGSMKSVIAQNHARIRNGEPLRLFRSKRQDYSDGGQLRDFIYVNDCVDLILWLMDNPQISGIYNVGTGRARSWLDLAQAMFAAVGQAPAIQFIDMPVEIADKYQYYTEATVDRLRSVGYTKEFTSLEIGIADYVQRFLASGDPYR